MTINEDGTTFDKLDLVKRYFSRIFNTLSKEVREDLLELELDKEELKEIKKELAFLSEEKQIEYLKELKTEKQRET
ncbi:MAG: hypothetical protein KGD73_12835 [Candidatus Lokiarchaeota archaeon]|nr:hypothetical protein [Candidatus Lokiarchaeota archaeon]